MATDARTERTEVACGESADADRRYRAAWADRLIRADGGGEAPGVMDRSISGRKV
ncbi:hypothetical protein NMK54_13135 [Nocardia otitidiscaviarum]|uniref:hypothetical protein n=1 Tax=Nocardia otitidiscaviarum TaxID=1823 RepID=UPI00163DE569|nr:hypothetical protein [Nocardia otitidiscaviarum]MCP9621101.1 hypothetical protein [Nocardia otitidiscaviarum]